MDKFTNYFFLFLTILSSLSLGYDYFYYSAYNKGMFFIPSQQKHISMKFVLSASLKIFLLIKTLLSLSPLIFIFIVLPLQVKISILWWFPIFISIFHGMFFIGYLYPKIKRIIYWDIKNPVDKWNKLYQNYNSSSKILLWISFLNFLSILIAHLVGLFR
ncbi:MAG: hypothetical protein ACK4G1_01055 [Ignavibacteria bacterium]